MVLLKYLSSAEYLLWNVARDWHPTLEKQFILHVSIIEIWQNNLYIIDDNNDCVCYGVNIIHIIIILHGNRIVQWQCGAVFIDLVSTHINITNDARRRRIT